MVELLYIRDYVGLHLWVLAEAWLGGSGQAGYKSLLRVVEEEGILVIV